jgi:hypothetical protein
MAIFKLPVSWESFGVVKIEARDEKEFFEKVESYRLDDSDLDLPSSTYIDGSFRIEEDDDVIKSYNQ